MSSKGNCKMKSERNKTIDISVEDGKNYLERCLKITQKASIEEITNKTLIGNCFEIIWNFGQQNNICAAGKSGVKRQPAGLISHNLNHHAASVTGSS